jgi:DNA-binding transcriptional LysR family regulator
MATFGVFAWKVGSGVDKSSNVKGLPQTPPRLAAYTIVPGGKYAAQGRPSYAHVYRVGPEMKPDGTPKASLCHTANGRDCIALCEAYVDDHDPIRQAVRAGMLIALAETCTVRPESCAYARHAEVLCTAMGVGGRVAEMDATWYVCRGVGKATETVGNAAAEVAATREDGRTPGEVRCPRIGADLPSWICGRCKGGC